MKRVTVYQRGYYDTRTDNPDEARFLGFVFTCPECGEENKFCKEMKETETEFIIDCLGCFEDFLLVKNII